TSSSTNSRNNKKTSLLALVPIRELPSFGSAPVNGVDANGFDIIEGPFAGKKDQKGRQRSREGLSSQHHQDDEQHQERRHPRIQFDFEDSPIHTADARDRLAAVKDMIRHAWFGFVPKMQKYSNNNNIGQQDIESKTQRIQIRGEWIDIMDTLLLASMTNEYNFAKNKVLELTGSQRESALAEARRAMSISSSRYGGEVQEEQRRTHDDVNDDGSSDIDTHGIGVFQTVVRQLGGLLSIYELEQVQSNEDPETLKAAVELGDQLALAFQGPNSAVPASAIFP
ncbi:hypothetical protein BGW39_003087, partial [Mortierella sp. 14UC]